MEKCRVNSTQIITSLITVVSIAVFGLLFNAAQAQRLSGYVDKPLWQQKNEEFNKRFLEFETYIRDGRAERIKFQSDTTRFQAEALERLARIEERLLAHTNEKKP